MEDRELIRVSSENASTRPGLIIARHRTVLIDPARPREMRRAAGDAGRFPPLLSQFLETLDPAGLLRVCNYSVRYASKLIVLSELYSKGTSSW